MMARVGRRPGGANTKEAIVEAAGRIFAEHGYDATTIRAVARAAEVDPALVYHYFGDKAGLFVTTFRLPVDPRHVKHQAIGDGSFDGSRVVERFLAQWEHEPERPGAAFRTLAEAVTASPAVARGLREFLAERLWTTVAEEDPHGDWSLRHSLVSSQLVGLAWARYILEVEPLASAPREQIARWVGPTLERYQLGTLEP